MRIAPIKIIGVELFSELLIVLPSSSSRLERLLFAEGGARVLVSCSSNQSLELKNYYKNRGFFLGLGFWGGSLAGTYFGSAGRRRAARRGHPGATDGPPAEGRKQGRLNRALAGGRARQRWRNSQGPSAGPRARARRGPIGARCPSGGANGPKRRIDTVLGPGFA